MKLPTADQYYQTMTQRYQALAGTAPADASDVGIRMRALAWELDALSRELERAWADIFPQSAGEQALELHAQARGLVRKPALPATGTLVFSRSQPGVAVSIPAGTLCSDRTGALRFETTRGVSIPQGETVGEAPAAALTAGSQGNAAPGAVCVILSSLPGVAGVSNPAAFAGGTEPEGDEALRARLREALARPADCANAAYYRGVAQNHPGIEKVKLLPRNRGVGTVDVLAACAPGQEEGQILDSLQAAYDAAREIGTDVVVSAPRHLPAEIGVMVVTAPGFDPVRVAGDCSDALAACVQGLDIGAPLLLARLAGCLLGVEGVENFRIAAPAGDIHPAEDQRITVGEISVGRVSSL